MSTTSDTWKCTSCAKPKAELKQRKSKVLPGVPIYMCKECIDSKMEPRAFIVLAGREASLRGENPAEFLAYWIKPQRYVGDPITLRELS